MKISSYFRGVGSRSLRIGGTRHVDVLVSHLSLHHVHFILADVACSSQSLLCPCAPSHQLIHTDDGVGSGILVRAGDDSTSSIARWKLMIMLEGG